MIVLEYVGKTFEYTSNDGKIMSARCTDVKFSLFPGKTIFTGETSFGTVVRLMESQVTFK